MCACRKERVGVVVVMGGCVCTASYSFTTKPDCKWHRVAERLWVTIRACTKDEHRLKGKSRTQGSRTSKRPLNLCCILLLCRLIFTGGRSCGLEVEGICWGRVSSVPWAGRVLLPLTHMALSARQHSTPLSTY